MAIISVSPEFLNVFYYLLIFTVVFYLIGSRRSIRWFYMASLGLVAVLTMGVLYLLDKIPINQTVTNVTLELFVSIGILIIILLFQFNNSTLKPINALQKQSRKLAEGDLTSDFISLKGSGEAKHLLSASNEASRQFKITISKLKKSSDELANAAQELASGSEEVAATTEEVTATIQSIAEGASEQVRRLDEVSKVLTEMVNVTEESIRQIGITSKITLDIAEQTNLVSLNASVSAAKAGEAGREFQVVAEYVRQLSIESKTASNTVRNITAQISQRMRDSVNKIVNSVDKIANVAENTAASSEEAAAAAEEQSAALQEITDQAQKLMDLADTSDRAISEFRT